MRINPEHSQAEARLAQQFGVRYYPSVFVVARPDEFPLQPKRVGIGANITGQDFVNAARVALKN